MTIVYFVIAALALVGAVVLLWLDRRRSTEQRHQRAVWGDTHDFAFRDSDTKLRSVFQRATMNAPEHVEVQDVAFGHYGGAEAVVFDLAETATVVAVRRSGPSPVIVDLRHEDVLAPAEDDVELLGAMGPRVMFSNNLEVARRVCDRRMIALANNAPDYIEVLWNEGNWALGSMPLTNEPRILDGALEVVRRFADLLRVLPPVRDPQDAPDPRDPHGPIRAELADEKTDHMRDKERRARAEADRSDTPPPAPRRPAPQQAQQPQQQTQPPQTQQPTQPPQPRARQAPPANFRPPAQGTGRVPAPGTGRPTSPSTGRAPSAPDTGGSTRGRSIAPMPIRGADRTGPNPAGSNPAGSNSAGSNTAGTDRAGTNGTPTPNPAEQRPRTPLDRDYPAPPADRPNRHRRSE